MVSLMPIHKGNWDRVAALAPSPSQAGFLPPTPLALLEAVYEQLEAWAIYEDAAPVGYLVLADFAGVPWLTRIMVAQPCQGRGIGRAALRLALAKLAQRPNAAEVRTTVATQNWAAERFFARNGFVRTNFADAFEFGMVRPLP